MIRLAALRGRTPRVDQLLRAKIGSAKGFEQSDIYALDPTVSRQCEGWRVDIQQHRTQMPPRREWFTISVVDAIHAGPALGFHNRHAVCASGLCRTNALVERDGKVLALWGHPFIEGEKRRIITHSRLSEPEAKRDRRLLPNS